ncbi:MAG: pilus assembly PilX N-terminal domain-containing protein [Thalassolituus sp.]|jgi:Tfp pilus assembly protein PilX
MKSFKQRGSALVVSLVMLTSVTFLAVLSLQGSTTEIRIVANMQIKQEMFYTTERELSAKFNRYKETKANSQELKDAKPLSTNALIADQFKDVRTEITVDATKIDSAKSKLRYINIATSTVNNNLIVGSSLGSFAIAPFEIIAETTDLSKRFKSEQLTGFSYLAPAN